MGKFATRRVLKSLLSRAKLTLYRHQLDGASYQYYAGGYVVNGYLGRRFSMSELKYEMQKGLIFLLKYGEKKTVRYNDGTTIICYSEPQAPLPLSHPVCDAYGLIYTFGDIEYDEQLQDWINFNRQLEEGLAGKRKV